MSVDVFLNVGNYILRSNYQTVAKKWAEIVGAGENTESKTLAYAQSGFDP